MNRTPIALIVDDPCPGVHLYHRTVQRRNGTALTTDGRPLLPFIGNDLLHDFVALSERYGLRGKFSVVPRPALCGSINTGLDGVSDADRGEWLALVRDRVALHYDLTPEMITHDLALDLATLAPLDEDEHAWSQHQTEASLRAYIGFALRELQEAGLDATGVTSPWSFGIAVEPAYARAVLGAQEDVYGRSQTWFFLRFSQAADARAEVAVLDGPDRWCGHVVATCDDFLWPSIDSPRDDEAFVHELADRYVTADGRTGRMVELLEGGGEIVMCTHWQSLFSNGTRVGLRALAVVAERVARLWSDRVEWQRCSALAAAAVHRALAGDGGLPTASP